jgi:hypothetical protein
MVFIIQKLTFPQKTPSYISAGGYGPTKWTDDIKEAAHYEFKDEAMMWATFYGDCIAREVKGRCRLWLETFNRYAYIKEVIGESTVTWTDEINDAGVFSYEDCRRLSNQYQTQIEEV